MSKIAVVEYDPAWPAMFERLKSHIWPSISDLATAIEHVGSTSVAGLAAKPIIDMTIVVPSVSAMPLVIEGLARIGYRHRGDLGVPGREAFAAPAWTPAHHLYACVEGNLALRNHLIFRNHLRQHPAKADMYARLKQRLAAEFPQDIDAYIDGKTNFILEILAEVISPEELNEIQAINRKPVGGL